MYLLPVCRILLACLLLLNAATCIAQDTYRHWTTRSGRRSDIRLKLIEKTSDAIRLQREDNDKIITMKLSMLSSGDRVYLARQQRAKTKSPIRNESAARASVGDWPQWRGPNRDGISPASGLIDQWPSDGPELLWNVTGLGQGYSTPAVTTDALYVLGTSGADEFVFALSAADGSKLWQSPIGTKSKAGGFQGPKGTPSVDGDFVFALGSDGTLVCIRREDGQSVWKKNLRSDFGGQVGHWEYAESPLIDGDKLICTPGGRSSTLVALKKSSGDLIWRSPIGQIVNDGFAQAEYSSAIIATIRGTRQYINFLHGGVVAVATDTGNPLWHYDNPANGTANCSTPVAFNNSVFAASGYGTGGGRADILRQGNKWNVNETYFVKKMESHHGGFVLFGGHIYGTNNSALLCLDWQTGAIKWQERSVGKGSVTLADGHLYVRGENGDVALVEATPEAYREKGRFSQLNRSGKNAWAHPVVANGNLYLHDDDRMLCYKLTK